MEVGEDRNIQHPCGAKINKEVNNTNFQYYIYLNTYPQVRALCISVVVTAKHIMQKRQYSSPDGFYFFFKKLNKLRFCPQSIIIKGTFALLIYVNRLILPIGVLVADLFSFHDDSGICQLFEKA